MSPLIRWVAASLIGGVILTPAAQAATRGEPADLRAGRELAENVCSACHQVEAQQEFPPALQQPTPSFQEIANRPGTTLPSLRRFMAHTKWDEHTLPMTMPNLMLLPDQQTELARYILSLRTAPPR